MHAICQENADDNTLTPCSHTITPGFASSLAKRTKKASKILPLRLTNTRNYYPPARQSVSHSADDFETGASLTHTYSPTRKTNAPRTNARITAPLCNSFKRNPPASSLDLKNLHVTADNDRSRSNRLRNQARHWPQCNYSSEWHS